MRIRGLVQLVSVSGVLGLVLGAGCSSSSTTPKVDASLDGFKFDTAVDVATDTPVDHAPTTDGAAGSDAQDAAAVDVAPPVATTQKVALTIIVTDQIGGDGGLEVGPAAAAAADAGADAGDGGASDVALGITVDPNLVNPWGLAFNPSGPLWVADNGTGLSTVYTATGDILPVVVTVPVPADGGVPPSAPTGLVFNGTATTFTGDKFIFSTEDGTISGWQTGATAVLHVDNSATNAVYKGLALATVNGVSRLFATDFHNGKVDAFDQAYTKVTPAGGFTDATLPAGFAPFGIQYLSGVLWVTYAKQDDMKEDDTSGVGNGYVDIYDFDGHLQKRLISQGALDSPGGIAVAPADFGALANALLVGNFGNGHINAYNPTTGALVGTVVDTAGAPIAIDGLWSILFGNDTAGAPHTRLFFTAGPKMESHGLLGHLDLP